MKDIPDNVEFVPSSDDGARNQVYQASPNKRHRARGAQVGYQPLTIEQQDWQRFLTRDGLSEKAGCSPDQFPRMVVKEFADNAADIGGFRYEIDRSMNTLSIINSGAGLSTEEIKKYFSIKRPLMSSKCLTSAPMGPNRVI
ncbi:hypothetical protein HGD85_02170 [Rhodobacteraceae bacterium R_SAG10]|nr:hypothetical protein [Rhodobacteraceae bacterium R_SAG10]